MSISIRTPAASSADDTPTVDERSGAGPAVVPLAGPQDDLGEPRPAAEPNPRRWLILGLLSSLQFMILLDMTIVTVALPQIQGSLGFTEAGLVWVVNGYVVAAGGLLILGGRLADHFGRRRLLLTGVVVFVVASALSGAAVHPAMMVLGRIGQGVAEAFAAPASLGLIALLFTDARERTTALGIWGGLVALGGTLGYVISGLLTDMTSWRWLFFVNLPVALVMLVLLPRLLPESRMVRDRTASLDIPGAFTLTAGLVGVVHGLLQAAERPWGSASVVLPLVTGVVMLGAMVIIERRASHPLIPLDFFGNRTRSVINITSVLFMAAFIPYTFMLTLCQQHVLGYSPLNSGLAWLPLGISIGTGIGLGTALIPRIGVKAVAAIGFAGAGVGLLLTSMITVESSYVGGLLPGMVVFGVFAGASMPAGMQAALHGVTVQDSSLASGVQNTALQVGSALGLAVLVTIALRSAGGQMTIGVAEDVAMTSGYASAFRIGAVLMLVGAALIAALLERVDTELRDPTAESLALDKVR